MKRNSRRITAIILMLILTVAMSGFSSSAADKSKYKIHKLKANKWNTLEYNTFKYVNHNKTNYVHLYKFSVPASGYITVQTRNTKKTVVVGIYKKPYIDADNRNRVNRVYPGEKLQNVVDKGTYYISVAEPSYNVRDEKDPSLPEVKYSFTKVLPTENYSPETTRFLKAKKPVTICCSPLNNYNRWYKIKLPKGKRITVWSTYVNTDVTVYDSNLGTISMNRSARSSKYKFMYKFKSTENQPAGTYYIEVEGLWSPGSCPLTVKWQ